MGNVRQQPNNTPTGPVFGSRIRIWAESGFGCIGLVAMLSRYKKRICFGRILGRKTKNKKKTTYPLSLFSPSFFYRSIRWMNQSNTIIQYKNIHKFFRKAFYFMKFSINILISKYFNGESQIFKMTKINLQSPFTFFS